MNNRELINLLKQDIAMFPHGRGGKYISLLITYNLRIGNYLISKKNIVTKIFLVIVKVWHFIISLLTGIQIPIGSKLGGGICFPHYGSIVIASSVKSGKNITILQNVTIGVQTFGKHKGYPILGDNVVIYAGSVICGNIRIGSNVIIGANSVVVNDVPDNVIVAGNPAKIICGDMISKIGNDVYKFYFPNPL